MKYLSWQASKRMYVALRNAVLLMAHLALAACGGGGSSSAGTAPGTPVTTTPAPPPPAPTPPATAPAAVTFLHVFGIDPTDAAQPGGLLLQASDGNFYGTSNAGGAPGCSAPDGLACGTLYKTTPSGETSVLYSFGRAVTDGWWPTGRVIQGKDGALYGMTYHGGAYGFGTVFRITLDGVYTVLHSFGRSAEDGAVPMGGLVQASDGYFYGATTIGGTNQCAQIPQTGRGNCGTIFKMSATGDTTILYSFGASPSDGVQPNGSLVQGADGNLYGTTANGGANTCTVTMDAGDLHNCGTVFRMTPAGAVTILHSFGATPSDGKGPQGPLLVARDGAFYGTTSSGGNLFGRCNSLYGCGTMFRMTTDGSISTVYEFGKSLQDGSGPSPYLIEGKDGNFYGTTSSGGAIGGDSTGTAFRVTPSGVSTTLYSFGPVNVNPSAPVGLIQARDGAFYGVTSENGRLGAVAGRIGSGTEFKLVVN